jgi:methylmalonyl-CoA mutase C-terminal domain/subunit
MEVIYTGLHQRPEDIVQAAVQEDVDAVGLSLLSGAHLTLVPEVCRQLHSQGAGDVLVFCGGIIPEEDVAALQAAGVHAVYGPGTPTDTIVEAIRRAVSARQAC